MNDMPPAPGPVAPLSPFDAVAAQAVDAVVIGAGPVGLWAAFELGLQGASVHVIDTLAAMGGQCIALYADKPIYDIPGWPVCTGRELATRLQQQIQPFSPVFHARSQVAQVQAHGDGRWRVQRVAVDAVGAAPAQWLLARTVFVTAGVGAFVPKQLGIPGVDALVGRQVFYHPELGDGEVAARAVADGAQHIVVHGGDEAAVQAAIAAAQHPLLQSVHIALLHRRDQFNAPQHMLQALADLRASAKIQVVIGMPQSLVLANGTTSVSVSGRMQGIAYLNPEGQMQTLLAHQLWVYQGISPKLGPLVQWGLALEKKQLVVAADTFATSAPGIYAAGDIVSYPGKRKLIVTGFSEATMAALAAVEYMQGQKLLLEYTTTSQRLHARLGVSHPQ